MTSSRTSPGVIIDSSVPKFISEESLLPSAKSFSYVAGEARRHSKLVQVEQKTYFQKTTNIHLEEYKLHLEKKIRKTRKWDEEKNNELLEIAELEKKALSLKNQATELKNDAYSDKALDSLQQTPLELEYQSVFLKEKRLKLLNDRLNLLKENHKKQEGFRQIEQERLDEHGTKVENFIFREYKGFIREVEVSTLLKDTEYAVELHGVSFNEEFLTAYLAASIIAAGATDEHLFAFFSIFYFLCPPMFGKILPNISLVTDYMPDGSLNNVIDDSKKLNTFQRVIIGRDIALGMKFLDSKGIVHRDINPANVMLQFSENEIRAKLIDFQTAFRRKKNNGVYGLGSTYYNDISETSNEAGDIFSLGRTLLHLFLADTQKFKEGVGLAALDLTDCPCAIKLLIKHCLFVNPYSRPSIETVIAVFDATIQIYNTSVTPQTELTKPVDMNVQPYLDLTKHKQTGANILASKLLNDEHHLQLNYSISYWRRSDYIIAELFNAVGSATTPEDDACMFAFNQLAANEYFKWFASEHFPTDYRFNQFVSYLNFEAPAGKTSKEKLIQLCRKKWQPISDSYLEQIKRNSANSTALLNRALANYDPNPYRLAIDIGALITDEGKAHFIEILNTPSHFRILFCLDEDQAKASQSIERFINSLKTVPAEFQLQAKSLINIVENLWGKMHHAEIEQKKASAKKFLLAKDLKELESTFRQELGLKEKLGPHHFYKLLLHVGAEQIDGDDGKEVLLKVARVGNSELFKLIIGDGDHFSKMRILNDLERADELRNQEFFVKLREYFIFLISDEEKIRIPKIFKELSDYFDHWLTERNTKKDLAANPLSKPATALQTTGLFSKTVTADDKANVSPVALPSHSASPTS